MGVEKFPTFKARSARAGKADVMENSLYAVAWRVLLIVARRKGVIEAWKVCRFVFFPLPLKQSIIICFIYLYLCPQD